MCSSDLEKSALLCLRAVVSLSYVFSLVSPFEYIRLIISVDGHLEIPVFLSEFLILRLHFLIHIIQCVRKSPSTRACPTKALLDSGIILVPKVIKHDVAQCLVEITLNRIIELLPHVSIVISELTGILHIEHHQFCD